METTPVAGCDPHKLTLTVAVVDRLGVEIDVFHAPNTTAGIAELVGRLDERRVSRVGVEGSAGHGHQLALGLVAAGFDVREVPARRTAARRRERRRPKTDRDDALAIARATAGDDTLGPARAAHHNPLLDELDAQVAWRDDLVNQRKRLLNRAEALLGELPAELQDITGRTGATLARIRRASTLSGDTAATKLRLAHLAEILADHDRLTTRIRDLERRLRQLVDATGTSLRDETGISHCLAARLLVEVGDPTRFRNEAAFARWCGTGAVAASSGEGPNQPDRHRLDLGGNRRVNSALHIMSVVQGAHHPDARAYLTRKRAEGKTIKEARRAHKRRLADRVIRRMWNDAINRTP